MAKSRPSDLLNIHCQEETDPRVRRYSSKLIIDVTAEHRIQSLFAPYRSRTPGFQIIRKVDIISDTLIVHIHKAASWHKAEELVVQAFQLFVPKAHINSWSLAP